MPNGITTELDEIVAQFVAMVTGKMGTWLQAREPAAFIAMEQQAHEFGRQLADALVALVLRQILCDPEFAADCASKAASTGRYRRNTRRVPCVTLLGGTTHELVRTPYMIAVKRRGRKKQAPGLFPCLSALGINDRCSPALISEVCRQDTESCSFRDAPAPLGRRGIQQEYKRTLDLVLKQACANSAHACSRT